MSFAKKVSKYLLSLELQSSPSNFLFGAQQSSRDSNSVMEVEGFRELGTQGLPCPEPLLAAEANNTNFIDPQLLGFPAGTFSCAFPCTGTMVNADDLSGYNGLYLGLSSLSFILVLFLFLTWGCFPEKSRQKMTFWISFSSLAVTSSVFIPALLVSEVQDIWCKDDLEGYSQSDGVSFCTIQAFCILFFGLSLCCWWFCSCYDIYCKLFRRRKNITHYLTYYHIFSWGIPTICISVLWIGGFLGYSQPRLWCFLNPDTPGAYDFIFFYGWVAVLWFFGTIMMILVIWTLLTQRQKYRKNRHRYNADSKKRKKRPNYLKRLSLYRTPLTFVIMFSFFWAVFFSFVIITETNEDVYVENAGAWFFCLYVGVAVFGLESPQDTSFSLPDGFLGAEILEAAGIDTTDGGCGDIQPGGVPLSLLTAAVITLSANGILIALIFGPQAENFRLWKRFLTCEKKPTNSRASRIEELRAKEIKKQIPKISIFREKYNLIYNFFVGGGEAYCGFRPKSDTENVNMQDTDDLRLQFDPQDSKGIILPPGMNFHEGTQDYTPGQGEIGFPGANQTFADTNRSLAPPPAVSIVQGGSVAAFSPPATAAHPPPPMKPDNENDPFPTKGTNQEGDDVEEVMNDDEVYDDDEVFSTDWDAVYDDPLWGVNVEF